MENHQAVFLTLAIGAIVTISVYLRNSLRFLYLASKVPGPSIWRFLTVHAGKLMRVDTCMQAFISLAEKSDYKPYGIWMKNGHFAVVVTDAESVRQVFKSTSMKNKAGPLFDQMSEYLGMGLITLDGDENKRHRRLLSAPFRKAALEAHLPGINEEVSLLIERIRQEASSSGVVNIEYLLQDKVKAVASLLITGKSFRAYANVYESHFAVVKGMSKIVRIQMLNPFWPIIKRTTSIRTKLAHYWQGIDQLKRLVFEKEQPVFFKRMEDDGIEPSNIAECMARHSGEKGFTDEEGFAEIIHILGASAESTDFAECVCLYLLALHPDVQERVYDEVQSILGEGDRAVESEDLSKMVYLDMVIKEVFRLFPPIPTTARRVEEETCFQGILLPKDCTILVDLTSLHRNPSHFQDPLKFDPERFSAERSVHIHPFAYLPFSYGKRDCIGQTYAIMSLKCSLSRIIKSFQVHPTEGSKLCIADIKFKMHITFVVNEMPLRFVVRNDKANSGVTAK